jgi:hypothetical protein
VDINLSSDDEATHLPMPDAPANQKMSAGDDTGDEGATSIKPTAPGPIRSGMLVKSKHSAIDQVLIVPPSSRCGRKCLHSGTRRSNPVPPVDQVMIQVELPPYGGPHSPLESVALEVIFGRIFEAFQQISQAAATSDASADDNKPLKRFCWSSLKKALVPRYLDILFLHLKTC